MNPVTILLVHVFCLFFLFIIEKRMQLEVSKSLVTIVQSQNKRGKKLDTNDLTLSCVSSQIFQLCINPVFLFHEPDPRSPRKMSINS